MSAALHWFVSHVLGGLVTGLLLGGWHYLLTRRHVTRTADRQTAELKSGSEEGCSGREASR